MPGETLHVWRDGEHVGEFLRDPHGRVSFRYDSDRESPISLSLPANGNASRTAAETFLENLLPDDENARRRMALRLHIDSIDTFLLLGNADTVGGLVFTAEPNLPRRPVEVRPVDDEEIAQQIGYVRANGYSWFARDVNDEFYERSIPRCRFSIAGGQPKFTLARRGGVWLWPNIAIPSTHIIKPELRDCPESDTVEDATMTLGMQCGLPVAEHGLLEVRGARAFITRRFDRTVNGNGVRRIHCEDLAQAMGRAPEAKYDIGAAACIRFLQRYDATGEMCYEWVRRLAFNVSSANYDAHGKNYSIMLNDRDFCFAPMYDMVATRAWPHLDQEMAMPINGVNYPELLTPHDWQAFASQTGLDEERVVHLARTMANSVLDHAQESSEEVSEPVRGAMLTAIAKANASIEPLDEPIAEMEYASSPYAADDV